MDKGYNDEDAIKEMLFKVAQEKGTDTVTTWFANFVAGGKGKKRGRDDGQSASSNSTVV